MLFVVLLVFVMVRKRLFHKDVKKQNNLVFAELSLNVSILKRSLQNNIIFESAYFFNAETNKCEQFYYGGCGGNNNRFETMDQCNDRCTNALGMNYCQDCKLAIAYLGKTKKHQLINKMFIKTLILVMITTKPILLQLWKKFAIQFQNHTKWNVKISLTPTEQVRIISYLQNMSSIFIYIF